MILLSWLGYRVKGYWKVGKIFLSSYMVAYFLNIQILFKIFLLIKAISD